MNRHEAIAEWNSLRPIYAAKGLILDGVKMLVPDEWKHSGQSLNQLAMDAAGTLGTAPNSALPAMLTTPIDPDVIRFVFAPLQMAAIMGGEVKAGDWLSETRIFPVVEHTREVARYGDFSKNG